MAKPTLTTPKTLTPDEIVRLRVLLVRLINLSDQVDQNWVKLSAPIRTELLAIIPPTHGDKVKLLYKQNIYTIGTHWFSCDPLDAVL